MRITSISLILVGLFLLYGGVSYAAPFLSPIGGTGTTSPSGILYGDNNATNHLNTVTIGSNLTFSGGTLSSSGGGSAGNWFTPQTYGNSTSTILGLTGIILTASSTFAQLGTGIVGSNNGLLYNTASTTAGTGLTYNIANNFSVNTSQNIATLSNLTTNGFITTSGSIGTLGIQQFPVTIAQGGTNATSFSANNILYTDSAGTTFKGTATSTLMGTATAGQVWGFNSNGTWGAVSTTTFTAGSNITLTTTGNSIAIAATGGGTFPFEIGNTNFATTTNSTSTALWFKMGLFASSTSNIASTTFNNTGIGISTSSPWAQLSVNPNGTLIPAFAIGSSTNTVFRVDNSGSTTIKNAFGVSLFTVNAGSTTGPILTVQATSSSLSLFSVDQYGHLQASSTVPVLSSCGTTPTLSPDSSDIWGTITVGSVAATACTLTFGTPHTVDTHCVISEQVGSVANASSYTEGLTGFTYSQTGLTSDKLDYICTGQ